MAYDIWYRRQITTNCSRGAPSPLPGAVTPPTTRKIGVIAGLATFAAVALVPRLLREHERAAYRREFAHDRFKTIEIPAEPMHELIKSRWSSAG